MIDLLRRAWDALDSFKQAYPENWNEDDEQVMVDLMRADMKMSGVQPKWVGLTDEEIVLIVAECAASHQHTDIHFARAIEAKLRSKNNV